MRAKNVHGLVREARPCGHSTKTRVVLEGAEIYSEEGDYLGWWIVDAMPLDVKLALTRELRQNWLPKNYDEEAL